MDKKFSFQVLWIKLSCRKLWVWAMFTVIVVFVLIVQNGDDYQWVNTLIHWYGVITLAFLLGNNTEKIAETIAGNTNINVGGR